MSKAQHDKIIRTAMRTACRMGFDPYNSCESQGKWYKRELGKWMNKHAVQE